MSESAGDGFVEYLAGDAMAGKATRRTPERLVQLLQSVNPTAAGAHLAGLCHEAAAHLAGRVAPPPQEYVVGFLQDAGRQVLLLRKNRPAWQAGHLNGVGGKVEPGERPHEAMAREFHEETRCPWPIVWRLFARLIFPAAIVHCFSADVETLPDLDGAMNDVGEEFIVTDIVNALSFDPRHGPIVANLRWLLPLAFLDPDRPVVEARG